LGRPNENFIFPTTDVTIFSNESSWRPLDPRLVEAWDVCSTFAVTIGIASPESRAAHVAGEFVVEDKLCLKTRAQTFKPSLELGEFCEAFDNCNEQLLAPIHTGLLRLAAATVYYQREDMRLKMETAKKNGHMYVEPNDELDRFGRIVDVLRDVKDGDFVHFLINGIPICESAWFELARVCFSWRRFNQKEFQSEVSTAERTRMEAELAQAGDKVAAAVAPGSLTDQSFEQADAADSESVANSQDGSAVYPGEEDEDD
jgi:hypothetical protein